MSKSPTPQKKFEVAAHEGYQFTERGFTRTKLLLSVTDARHEWVGWYVFVERLVEVAAKTYDLILMRKLRADTTIQFGLGSIDRTTILTRHPRTIDSFASGPTTARVHDARFVSYNMTDGDNPAKGMRLEMFLSFDLKTGTEREIVHARVSMLSPERPHGNIHPAVGFLLKADHQTFAKARLGPSHDISKVAQNPV
jgi:hypothetical protein